MSISKRGSHTPVGDDAPLGDNRFAGDQFNRFEIGSDTPADDAGDPGPEIGISAPTPDDVVPADNPPADDGTSTGEAGDSLAGLGTWESVIQLEIAGDDDESYQKGEGVFDPRAANTPGSPGQLLTLGTNPDGSHFFSGNRNVDATLIGSKWSTLNLTFSFPTSGSNYNGATFDSNGVSNYHIDLGAQQQASALAAFAQLSAVTGLTFTQITDTDAVHANIRISQTADQDVPSAYGNFASDTSAFAGDIWFGRNNQPYYDLTGKGTWGYATMMHEIGHTMGLKHGHQDYTNSDLSGFLGTSPRFGSQSLTPDRDGQAWSLMTYTPAPFTNSNFAGDKISQPQTYMQYDLAALQYMYGANFNTNSGDSVYTFSQTTGEMFINGVGQGAPAGNKIFLTIWDGGGNDTIDASNYANGVTIDLRPGEFSTFDQAQLVNNLAAQNLVNLAPGNIAMSLLYNNDSRSLIENATGGAGNDIFVGNTANNVLDGGSGGSDSVIFTNTTGVNVTLNDLATDVIVTHDGETDTLRSIENIGGTSGNDTITGNSLENVLTGGSGGTDNLSGGDGNDRLVGGGFTTTTTFSAPSQPDITKPQATNNGSIATAVATAGFFDVDANPDITNATSIPHATINATAFGGSVEYYRIDVTVAGSTAIFDIDGLGTLDDSILELVNSGGTVIANNDTGTGDASAPGHDDAYLTFTFNTVGTFYIRVGRFISNSVAQPLIAGQTYQLNISLQNAAVVTTTVTANNTSSLVADGGEGNDLVVGTLASDTLTGGNGNDTASFVNAFNGGSTTGVTVNLNLQGAAQNTVAAGNDTLIGFENLVGSALNDTLTGDGNDNFIEGGLGNDTLVGGLGNDTASYAGATAGVTAGLDLQGSAQNTVNAGTDTLNGFENLAGSAFNDSLTGDANLNILSGGAGDDTLNPGSNAGGIADLLDGGIGSDTASFAGIASPVTATLNGASDGTASIAGGAIATLRSIENLTGGFGADFLTGDGNANVIEGGGGNDILDGGAGVDTVAFTGAAAVTVNLATTSATGVGIDTVTNFENVRTGSGGDTVTGDGNDNIFFDGGGNDTYNGAGGIDTVDYSAATSTVTVDLNTATASRGTFGGTDTITNMENVVGAALFGNTLTGNTLANRLTGGAAADVIEGRNGADVIFGGAGNDTLLGGTTGALDDGSADTLEGGAGNDFMGGGQGNDILRGGEGDDTLAGGVVNNINQFFTGVDGGDDTYDGGDGTDVALMVYDGRLGVGASTVGIAFDIGSLAGNSAITFNGVNVGSMTSIERVTFRGTTVDDAVRGGGSLDSLTGGAGNDVLDGWYGNDLLDGGLGNDTLIGGEGLDTATYVNSTAGVNVDLRILVAQNTGGQGIDTLSGIEYLIGSAFGDTLRGDDDFNLIVDSGVGAGATALSQTDSLFGFAGNDSILVTRGTPAAAVATNINMDGGDGDDMIELRGGTLSVAVAGNLAGLIASSTGATQTYLVAGATSNDRNLDVVTVDGGAGNDRIILTGVASATVNAGSGADLVSISMRGATSVNNYQLTLGSGADIIQLGVGSNAANSLDVAITARTSRVTDFQVGDAGDKFELTNFLNFGLSGYTANSNAFASGHLRLTQSGSDLLVQVDRDAGGVTNIFVTVFAISNGYTGGFTAFNFDGFIGNLTLTGIAALNETITGATGNDVLSGGDGNDALIGLAGTDTLNGGNGDDTLTGGAGNDSLFGGNNLGDAGFDSAVFSGNRSDYQVNFVSFGVVQVIDLRVGSPDGTDTLSGIERVVFADDDYAVDPNTGVLTSNFPPMVTGPVLGSATEGGGVYFFNPLANASDPDANPGDGLVVIPVGPLPAGVSFVGGSAATISFSDYALGSVVGQHGWTDATPTSPDNEIVDVLGNRMLRLANDPTSGDFGGPFSPAFAISAGEATAPADTLTFSFVIKAVNNVADGSRLEIDLGSSDRDDRYNFMVLEYTAGGLRLAQNTPTTTPDEWASNNFDWGGNVQLGALLDASVSHTIQVIFRAVDGSNNDIVEYYVDGMLVGTGSTFENFGEFHASQPHASAINQVNNVLFRAGDPAGNPFPADGPGGNRQGFYIDDLAMAAYDSHQLQFNANDPAYDHLAAGATQLVTVNYNVADGHGGVTPTSTVITVTGTNDGATITGVSTGAVVESGVGPGNTPNPGIPSASGMLTVTDVDDGQAELTPIPAGAGVYGTFAVAANGSWTYTLNNADTDTNALYVGQVVTDTITVHSEDNTASQVITVTITGTNDLPVVSGPVLGSATEGGGVYFFNPLANASDPDAGDGLVVIPVGPLPAGVSFVGGSAATIDFSGYALGSVIGQFGWTDGSPGSPDNEIVDVSGNRMLRLANDPTSGDFAGPFSPAFAISAGEAAAPADTLSFSFVIRAVNGMADGSRLEIDLGSSDRDDRYNFMAIEYVAGGLRLVQNTPSADGVNWQSNDFDFGTGSVQLGALLNASVSHTIQVIFRAVDGSNNDIVEYYVDGMLVGTGSTFENFGEFHASQPHASAINQVNNVLFRAGDPAGNPFPADGPGGNRQGFYIDDLAMAAYDSHQLQFNANDPAYDHLAAGATQLVTVNYNVADGHGGVTPTSTVITVTGTNDGATITGVATGAVVESGVGPGNTPFPGTPTATGMLTVSDVDDGEAELAPVNAAGANGYGTFAVAANGSWTYTLDNADSDTQALYVGQVVNDSIVVHSEDNTASQTITVTITGTNDAPVITNGPGAASGSVTEGFSPSNLTPAGAAGGLEPAVNYDGQIVSLLAAHPDDMPAVLAGIQASLPAGSNGLVNAIAVMWDYVDDHFSYYDTVINEISGRLSAEYARYLVLGGAPLTGTAAKYAPDGGDVGTSPDRLQSLHDNLLGNLNLAGLNDKLRGPPYGSNPNPDESAYTQIIALLASYGLSDVVNRPYFGGYEGETNLATAYDQAHNLQPAGTGGQLTASDVDSDAVLTWSGSATGVYGAFAITAGGAWTYNIDNLDPDTQALAAGTSAVDTFTATVTDNHGATATEVVTVIVYGSNDAPVAVADTNAGTEDGALVTGSVATNDSDVDTGAVLSYALAAPVAGLTINPNGSYSFDPGDAAYDHIALGATQVVTANYIVSDGNGGSSTSTLTITVTGINDAPDAVNDTASAIEDGAVVLGSVAGNDTDVDDGATRTWALVAPVAGLSLDSAGNYVFNPLDPAYQHIALGATQTVVASYRVTDQYGATDIATLTVTVAGTNDAPDAANDVNSATEDGAILSGNVGSNDIDIDDGATRTFALVAAAPAGLTFNADGSYSFNPANAAYQHLAVGATDTLVVSYTISDGIATDTATLTITVNGANDAPIAADDVNTAIEDGAVVTGTVATGDTDVDDGATRTYALSGSVAGLTINPNGSYSFDPASYDSIAVGDTQIVTATYIVTDDQGATDTGTLTITVTGVNDAPDAVNDTITAVEDGALVTGTVATNDTDADIGDTRTYTLNAPVAGLTLNSDGSYSFNPANAAYQHIALGATQTVSATYTFADNNGASDTATLTITVTGINDAPDAVADTIVATEDGVTVSGNLGVNDTDADDGATRTYLLVAPVTGLTLTPSGNYTFDPSSYDSIAAGSSVTLSTSYRVIDNNGATDTATISITIHGINDAPDAVNDVVTAIEDGAIVTGNVSFNDLDADGGDSRTYAQFGAVDGLTINSDGSFSFDPTNAAYQHIRLGATEVVVATYTMTDGAGVTDTATLTITVSGRNDAPIALFDLASASEDGAIVTGNVGDNDVDVDDGAARSFIPVGPVPAGLTFNPDGSYVFDPSDAAYQHLAAGVTQAVVLSYRITDQHGATGNSTLTITVTGTNDGPIAADDVAAAVEDGAVVTGNVGAGDADADDGASLTYALNGTVPGLTIAANGDYSFDPSDAAYQHLAQGATDIIVATYIVTDQFGASDTATLTITIAGANDAPVALDDSRAVNEDGGTIIGNVGANDTDADDGATRSFLAVGPLPAGLSFNADGSYSFDPSDAAYQTLAAGVTQLVSLTYTITDDFGATGTATLNITVTGANDAPVAGDDVASATEDGAVVTGNVGANDIDADTGATRTYALVGPAPAGLTFDPDGSYSFDPASYDSLAFGATQILVATYTMTDGQGATDTATLTITVHGINDAPDAVNDVNGATEDGAIVTGNVATNDTDVDVGDTQTYALVAPVAGLTLAANGSYSFDPASYDSLALGATQIVVATYTLTDGQGATDTATLTITVTGVNDAPDAVNDVAGATEDGAIVTGSVATNDSDVDVGDTRAYTLAAPVAGLTLNADGSYSFDPASYDSLAFGATQIVVATYTMTDGQAVTDTATLTITVTGVNDAPDAANDVDSATEDGAVVTGNVATNDSDVDVGDTRIYTLNAPVAGLILHANGSYSFDPASYDSLALGATQIVVATYTMTDGQGATDTATLTITVTGVNDAPDAVNDVASATEDGAIVTGSVATNDSNVDAGDTRAYTLNAPVAGLTFNADGSYSFNPANSVYQSLAAGATQNVIASYTVTDSLGATGTATLTITVTGTDDAPVIHPDAFVTAETTPLAGNLFANNGSGADSDVDGPALAVAAVNGSGANVGTQITLASGARLTVNLDGSFVYDPNHAFDATPAAGSGASNPPASDSFTYTLAGGGTATVTLSITGVDSNDTLNGTAGNDVLNGGIGADTMTGLAGDDIYFVESSGDVVVEAAGQGFDTVYATASYALSAAASVEVLSAASWAGTAPIALTGSNAANTIFGNAGDNVLNGGGGVDSLYGFGGDDIYILDNAADAVAETAGAGYDTIFTSVSYTLAAGVSAEVLSVIDWTATVAMNLTGNELANRLYGNAGANVLTGGVGDDLLWGLGGGDTLIGGVGDDVYWIYALDDGIVETAGNGFETTYLFTSYALAADASVEVMSTFNWLGFEAINLTGNGINNIIYGNAGASTINGGGGADLLFGLGGVDTFAFTTALGGGNVDTLIDFVAGTDKIALDDAIFTAITGGTLNGNAFVIGAAAGDDNDRIIYNSTTGQLFYDADGNGSGAAIHFANLSPGLNLMVSDFQMI